MANASSNGSLGDPSGQDFGPYKLVRRLGVGGMAETFEAIRMGPGSFSQRVCLKLVLPFYRDRQDFREFFDREARLAAKLRHGNVVGVIDFGQIDGVSYIAFELVDGVDLASLLDSQSRGVLAPEHVALIGHDLAAALEHAHDPRRDGSAGGDGANAIIHRDISPSNVLISERGEVLLTDFGVAKAITGTARQQSAVKGKVPYMSPEQLRAETLDGRADLFALGVVLFEALAGQRPFQGEHDPATIMMILNGNRPSLHEMAPEVPLGLCQVVEGLLQTNRDDRPPSAAALLEQLEPFVPSYRARQALGTLAFDVRASKAAWSSRPAASDVASGVSQSSGSLAADFEGPRADTVSTRPPSRLRSRRSLVGLVGMLLVLGLAGIASRPLWIADGGEEISARPPEAHEPTGDGDALEATADDPALIEAAPSEPGGVNASADHREETPSEEAPVQAAVQTVKPARLTVVVFPWGDVWINGKAHGSAPLKNVVLEPGHYKIEVGQGRPTRTRTIRVREAQRKTVQFDLTK
ncbi:MAG: serine/threonine-protein kinase [Polyangiales bacterium]